MAYARALSVGRILILRLRFGRRIVTDRRTFVEAGCHIVIARGGTLVLNRAHLKPGVLLEVSPGARLEVGASFIGTGSMLSAHSLIRIGNGCQIAEYTSIRDHEHVHDATTPLDAWLFRTDPVTIHDDVWLGSKVTVTAGVVINSNATCGAGAVVTRDVEAGAVVVGVPARPLVRGPADQPGTAEPSAARSTSRSCSPRRSRS